jgi:hypothetical protein
MFLETISTNKQFSQKMRLTFEVMCQPSTLWTPLKLNDRLITNGLGKMWILDTDNCLNICLKHSRYRPELA